MRSLVVFFLMPLSAVATIICDTQDTKPISVISSRLLEYGDVIVEAASGIALVDGSYYIVSDDSREIAELTAGGSIRLYPLVSRDALAQKKRMIPKADFEAATLLPGKRILVLGSGWDRFKNTGAIFDTRTKTARTIDLSNFYAYLLSQESVVGPSQYGVEPRLNIEGVSFFGGNKIAFFHRANYNKNSHDSMVVFSYPAWLREIIKDEWKLEPLEVKVFDFGYTLSEDVLFPVTLHDAFFRDGSFYIPLSTETDFLDSDGEVIWTGLAKVSLDGKCEAFHFTDPQMPKIEGLTFDEVNQQFVAGHDVDSAGEPSLLSIFQISQQVPSRT